MVEAVGTGGAGRGETTAGFYYPAYTTRERLADGLVHLLGISGSIAATVWLWLNIVPQATGGIGAALGVYCVTIICLFCFSGAYHMTPVTQLRPLLRRFDQAAIFLKISGTYTPFVVFVDTWYAYALLGLIWLAALAGACAKLVTGDRLDRHTVVLYLALGWASLLLIWPMFMALPFIAAWMVIVGGVLYTIGVIFHQWESLTYHNAIWHAFVLVASACHMVAIVISAMAAVS